MKAIIGAIRLLETECSEGHTHEAGRPVWFRMVFMCRNPERSGIRVRRASRAGVRVSIVVMKRGNSRGAKGHRKVDVEVS